MVAAAWTRGWRAAANSVRDAKAADGAATVAVDATAYRRRCTAVGVEGGVHDDDGGEGASFDSGWLLRSSTLARSDLAVAVALAGRRNPSEVKAVPLSGRRVAASGVRGAKAADCAAVDGAAAATR